MTDWIVVDSGILLASALTEKHSVKAKAILKQWNDQKVQIAAPTLFRYEIVAVMRKSVFRNLISTTDAIKGRDLLLQHPVQLLMDDELLKRGFELATKFNRPTAYDAQYLAVAERLNCDFWTADEKLYNAISSEMTSVKWLGNFTLAAP